MIKDYAREILKSTILIALFRIRPGRMFRELPRHDKIRGMLMEREAARNYFEQVAEAAP